MRLAGGVRLRMCNGERRRISRAVGSTPPWCLAEIRHTLAMPMPTCLAIWFLGIPVAARLMTSAPLDSRSRRSAFVFSFALSFGDAFALALKHDLALELRH